MLTIAVMGAVVSRVDPRMDRTNPIYIPRNHLVERALESAEGGDLAPFHALLEVLSNPFDADPSKARYAEPAPESFGDYVTFCGT